MSEEVQETNTNEVVSNDTDTISRSLDDVDDPKELKKLIKSLRSENAASRQKRNALDSELEEFRSWKESQQSENEKLQERLKKSEAERTAILVDKLCLKYGVDDEFKEFVVGGSEEEMESRAKKLGSKNLGSDNSDSDSKVKARLLGGNRGTPVGKKENGSKPSGDAEAEWFKALYDNE